MIRASLSVLQLGVLGSLRANTTRSSYGGVRNFATRGIIDTILEKKGGGGSKKKKKTNSATAASEDDLHYSDGKALSRKKKGGLDPEANVSVLDRLKRASAGDASNTAASATSSNSYTSASAATATTPSTRSSSIKDLLGKFSPGSKLGNNASDNVSGRRPTASSRFSQDIPTKKVDYQGASLRDTLRQSARTRDRQVPQGGASDRGGAFKQPKSESRRILDNLGSSLPTAKSPRGRTRSDVADKRTTQVKEADFGEETEMMLENAQNEPTSGEERYQRHLENQRRKRIEMDLKYGGDGRQPQQRSHSQGDGFNNRGGRQQQQQQQQRTPRQITKNDDGTPRLMTMAEQIKFQQEKLVYDRERNQQNMLTRNKMSKNGGNNNDKFIKKSASLVKIVNIPASGLTVRELAQRLSIRLEEVVKCLRDLGESLDNDNSNTEIAERVIDSEIAELIVLTLDDTIDVRREEISVKSDKQREQIDGIPIVTAPRDPVVCVMGHVDHGKTSILDFLRKASVAAGEAGGITQRLSAFRVKLPSANNRQVVFLDTPGHAAFSTMRSHGVSATDLVVLVVAIDDGVKTQTKEALKTAKEAGCNIIVALNKCDKFKGDIEGKKEARARVLAQLVEHELVAEDYGGDTMVVETSALAGEGLDDLVESIALQADMLELKAAYKGQCEAVVLDANMEKGRGVVADVLVRWGQLSVGDSIVVDTMFGKVKAIVDDQGNKLKTAGPSTPVRILGLRSVPTAGQELLSVDTETKARDISDRRQRVKDLRALRKQANHDSVNNGTNGIPTLEVILKADGVGSLEALTQIVTSIGNRTDAIKITIVDGAIGDVTRGDVETASTSNAIILGFNVGVADSTTRSMAKEADVTITRDNIIYRLEEKLLHEMSSVMPMERHEHIDGKGAVQQVFNLNTKSKDQVAGLLIDTGFFTKKINKGAANYFPVGFRIHRESAQKEYENIKNVIEKDPSLREPGGRYEDFQHVDLNDNTHDRAQGIVFREETINDDTVTLRRFKDIVHTVESGNECGLSLPRFKDWKEGDIVECYRIEMKRKPLVLSD